MENDILYIEKQRFNQWWIWLLFFGINALFIFGAYQQLFLKIPFGNKPMSDYGILFGLSISILLTILFFQLKLETIIKYDGVYVKFFPFHFSYRKYSWDTIDKIFIRKYNPISEYGGWGLRYGLFGAGKAFNVSGTIGLQIEFKDGKKLLIGTKKSKELEKIIEKFKK